MNQEKIGKLISEKRKIKGLTQAELGKKLGVGGKAVSKWETGLTSPDISILRNLSKELNIELNLLLGGEEKTNILKKNSKRNKIIIILLMLIITLLTFIIASTFQTKDNILNIYSKNDIIGFNGHILNASNKKVITINVFKLLDYTLDCNVVQYSMILSDSETIIGGYYYFAEDDNSSESISELLKLTIIDVSDLDKDYKINYDNLSITLEYTDDKYKSNRIELDMIID